MHQSAFNIKPGRFCKYWPELPPEKRRAKLYRQWRKIVALLENEIRGVAAALPDLEPGTSGAKVKAYEVKAYEDKLDAVVCAWVAICALQGRAKPFGDHQSAIWVPVLGEACAISI